VALAAWSCAEALWTTPRLDGHSGPLASRLAGWAWRGARWAVGTRRHRALSLAGPAILVSSVLVWVATLRFGWTLVFYSDLGALRPA